jgi:hypothetical protein
MAKLSTTPPKQLMNPPMWIMPKSPVPSIGVVAWFADSLDWVSEFFTEKPSKTNVVCGTMLVYSGKLKFTDEFIKGHGLDECYQASINDD